MFKISVLFKKNTNFTAHQLENFYDQAPEIFRVLFLSELKYIGRLCNLH